MEGSVCHFKGDQMILDFYKNNVRDEKPDNTGAGILRDIRSITFKSASSLSSTGKVYQHPSGFKGSRRH